MVKLIHFQGYPSQLLPLLVSGIPSMHIATDFLPELLAQSQLEKQVETNNYNYIHVLMLTLVHGFRFLLFS